MTAAWGFGILRQRLGSLNGMERLSSDPPTTFAAGCQWFGTVDCGRSRGCLPSIFRVGGGHFSAILGKGDAFDSSHSGKQAVPPVASPLCSFPCLKPIGSPKTFQVQDLRGRVGKRFISLNQGCPGLHSTAHSSQLCRRGSAKASFKLLVGRNAA